MAKVEISETRYRELCSIIRGLRFNPQSTRFRNAVRRAGILARRLPSVEQLKRNNETARDNNNGHDQQ